MIDKTKGFDTMEKQELLTLVKQGLDTGIVVIQYNSYDCFGINCSIGDFDFYFSGYEGNEIESIEEYWRRFDKDMTAEMVADTLFNYEENGLSEEETEYYISVLKESVKNEQN